MLPPYHCHPEASEGSGCSFFYKKRGRSHREDERKRRKSVNLLQDNSFYLCASSLFGLIMGNTKFCKYLLSSEILWVGLVERQKQKSGSFASLRMTVWGGWV
jgi:hypothetical protein